MTLTSACEGGQAARILISTPKAIYYARQTRPKHGVLRGQPGTQASGVRAPKIENGGLTRRSRSYWRTGYSALASCFSALSPAM